MYVHGDGESCALLIPSPASLSEYNRGYVENGEGIKKGARN